MTKKSKAMIQTILALTIVGLAVAKTVYSLYKAITTKEKSLCGGCASCDLKNELKKKGKLTGMQKDERAHDLFSPGNLRFIARK
jgi:7-cyano-7-deazaguanine synthase in queuosine biosynthesis